MRLLKLDCCKPLLDYYSENCAFTEEEQAIIEMRRKGVSLVAMARRMNVSQSSVSDRIRSIKEKMEELDKIKPYVG